MGPLFCRYTTSLDPFLSGEILVLRPSTALNGANLTCLLMQFAWLCWCLHMDVLYLVQVWKTGNWRSRKYLWKYCPHNLISRTSLKFPISRNSCLSYSPNWFISTHQSEAATHPHPSSTMLETLPLRWLSVCLVGFHPSYRQSYLEFFQSIYPPRAFNTSCLNDLVWIFLIFLHMDFICS